MTRVQEQSDGDGHFASGDQVVEDDGYPLRAILPDVFVAVLEDHEGGRLAAIVLGRDVDPALARGAWEHLRLVEFEGLDLSLEHAGGAVRGFRCKGVVVDGPRGRYTERQQGHGQAQGFHGRDTPELPVAESNPEGRIGAWTPGSFVLTASQCRKVGGFSFL